jgi:hypothetical protein
MIKNPSKTAKRFLEYLHSRNTQETITTLIQLMEELEVKNDPEMTEVRLVENIGTFLEKFRIMENNINSYVKDTIVSAGNKLTSLYEEISNTGSIFRD